MMSRGSIFQAESLEQNLGINDVIPRLNEADTNALWSLLKDVKTHKSAYEQFAGLDDEDDSEEEEEKKEEEEEPEWSSPPREFGEHRARNASRQYDEDLSLSSHSDIHSSASSSSHSDIHSEDEPVLPASEFVSSRLESDNKATTNKPDWDQFYSMECYPSLTTESPSLNLWSIPSATAFLSFSVPKDLAHILADIEALEATTRASNRTLDASLSSSSRRPRRRSRASARTTTTSSSKPSSTTPEPLPSFTTLKQRLRAARPTNNTQKQAADEFPEGYAARLQPKPKRRQRHTWHGRSNAPQPPLPETIPEEPTTTRPLEVPPVAPVSPAEGSSRSRRTKGRRSLHKRTLIPGTYAAGSGSSSRHARTLHPTSHNEPTTTPESPPLPQRRTVSRRRGSDHSSRTTPHGRSMGADQQQGPTRKHTILLPTSGKKTDRWAADSKNNKNKNNSKKNNGPPKAMKELSSRHKRIVVASIA